MKKTIFFCASILICFIPNTYVFSSSDEIEMREFQDGVLIYKLSEFKEEEWPKELKDKLLACGDCPGIDGYLPDYYTKSIELRLKEKAYRFPKTLIEDLYNPHVGKAFHRDALSRI